MSLDIYFYKKDFDIQKNRDDLSESYRKFRAIQDEIERLENDYEEAKLYSLNITHNLNNMAKAVGLYEVLWRPKEVGITSASQMIAPLEKGLEELVANPDKYKALNPPNGYGSYDDFVSFCRSVLHNCREYPNAVIEASA
jgi:hypothetical protein